MPVLRRHRLAHFPELKVDPKMLEVKFSSSCSVAKCGGRCCKGGVWLDIEERDRILAHAAIVIEAMDDHQVKDPSRWFTEGVKIDPDFPSGKMVGTIEESYGCVFLNSGGMCVLQKAQEALPPGSPALKPFFCWAFPISIEHGVLLYDHYMGSDEPQCCSPDSGGERDIFDHCGWELEWVLGTEGVEELNEISKENAVKGEAKNF
jgi:hypothetical protein